MPSHPSPSEGRRMALTSNLIVAPLGSTIRTNTPALTNSARPTLVLAASGVGSALETANTKGRFITAATTELNTPDIKREDILGERNFHYSDPSKHSAGLAKPAESLGMAKVENGGESSPPSLSYQRSSTNYCDMSPFTNDQVHQENEMDMAGQSSYEDNMDIGAMLENNGVFDIFKRSANSPLNQEENIMAYNKDLSSGNEPVLSQAMLVNNTLNQTSSLHIPCTIGAGSTRQQLGEMECHGSPPSFANLLEEPTSTMCSSYTLDSIFPAIQNDPVDTMSIDVQRGYKPEQSMECEDRIDLQKAVDILDEFGLTVHLQADQPVVREGSVTLTHTAQPSFSVTQPFSLSTQPSTSYSALPSTNSFEQHSQIDLDGGLMALETPGHNGTLQPQPTSRGLCMGMENQALSTTSSMMTHTLDSGMATHTLTHTLDSGMAATHMPVSGMLTHTLDSVMATHASVSGMATHTLDSGMATHASISGMATHTLDSGMATHTSVSGMSTPMEPIQKAAVKVQTHCKPSTRFHVTPQAGKTSPVRVRRVPKRSSKLQGDFLLDESINLIIEGGVNAGNREKEVIPNSNTCSDVEFLPGVPSTSSGQRGRRRNGTKDMTDEQKYRRTRDLNNKASRRCRERKKDRIVHLQQDLETQTQRHKELQQQVAILTKRKAILKLALQEMFNPAFSANLKNR